MIDFALFVLGFVIGSVALLVALFLFVALGSIKGR